VCFVLYMASDKTRPLISWEQTSPAFHVKADDADAEKTRAHFNKKYIYYLGSDAGCGCGFPREYDDLLDHEELKSKRENQRQLVDYLTFCLRDESFLELYGCWSGDEEEAPEKRLRVTIDELAEESFLFLERHHLTVTCKNFS
jgi:hypothetical protein